MGEQAGGSGRLEPESVTLQPKSSRLLEQPKGVPCGEDLDTLHLARRRRSVQCVDVEPPREPVAIELRPRAVGILVPRPVCMAKEDIDDVGQAALEGFLQHGITWPSGLGLWQLLRATG